MIDSYFRPPLQKTLFDPIVERLHRLDVNPNTLTFLSLFTGLCFLPAFLWVHPLLAILFLWVSGLLDVLDGSLARKNATASLFGALLDITSDRAVEFILVFTFFLADPGRNGMACLLLLGSFYLCITTFLMAGILEKNLSEKSFHYSPGLIERSEVFLFFTAMIMMPQYFPALALVFSALVFLTVILRLKEYLKRITVS